MYRTKKNLEVIEKLQDDHKSQGSEVDQEEVEVYEVTQLVNSLLGLLIFPKEINYDQIPTRPIAEYINQGWPLALAGGRDPNTITLQYVIRSLRNAVAHFHIEFIPDDQNRIQELLLWNMSASGVKNWETKLSLYELQDTVYKFIDLLMVDIQKKYNTSSIIISHDLSCVELTANKIVMLIDGKNYAQGTYEELSKSDDVKVKNFYI